jgi:hypothetical protein
LLPLKTVLNGRSSPLQEQVTLGINIEDDATLNENSRKVATTIPNHHPAIQRASPLRYGASLPSEQAVRKSRRASRPMATRSSIANTSKLNFCKLIPGARLHYRAIHSTGAP